MARPARNLVLVLSAVMAVFLSTAPCRAAFTPAAGYAVTNDAQYQALLDAGVAAEIVRLEISLDPNPRLVAAAACLAAFAERNPLADQATLATYAAAIDTELAVWAPSDPDLFDPANFAPAIRFATDHVDPTGLAGTDRRVGQRAMELLAVDFAVGSRSVRATRFDRLYAADFANSSPFAALITSAMLDRVATGAEAPGLGAAMTGLLLVNGIDPAPTDLAAAYPELAAGLAGAPADYAAFVAARDAGFAGQIQAVGDEFGTVSASIDAHRDEIAQALNDYPDLFEASQNAADPVLLAQLMQDRQDAMRARAVSRSTLALNALLIAQGDSGAQEFARQARDFSDTQLQVDTTMSDLGTGFEIGGNVLNAASQFAQGNPAAGVGSILLALGGVFGIVDEAAPTPEQQIFDQIVQLRQQVEDLRVEMNTRFDSIDRQLNVIYEAMSSGLNEINETTKRIERSVTTVQVELYELKSALASLQANLYGVLSAGFEQDFILDMETGIGYRDRTGVDLEFVGSGDNTYFAFDSRFAARATTIALDELYAGPAGLTLTNDGAAAATLNGAPLGYHINNLRQFPQLLGLPVLGFGRVANPTTWSLTADAYAQLARENPWYFAKINQNDPSRLQQIIDAGENVRATMAAARSRPLFEALIDQYVARVDALDAEIGVPGYLASRGMGPVDPWQNSDQDVTGVGPDLNTVRMPYSNSTEAVFFDKKMCWEPFDPAFGLAAAMNLPGYTASRYSWEWGVTFTEGTLEWRAYLYFWDTGTFNSRGYFENLFNYVGPVAGPPEDDLDYFRAHPEVFEQLIRAKPGDTIEGPDGYQMYVGDFDLRNYLPSGLVTAVDNRLGQLQTEFWTDIDTRLADPDNQDLIDSLLSGQELLSAYTSIALPETFRHNDVVKAALRGSAAVRSGLGGAWIRTDYDAGYLANTPPPTFAQDLKGRAARFMEQVGPALDDAEDERHAYLEWSLESLESLAGANASLCVDDTYAAQPGAQLSVDAAQGVLANDAQQPGAQSIVAALIFPASNGSVSLNTDGSFTYTPNPGFEGLDSFLYIATANLAEIGSPPNLVTGNTATVVIRVEASVTCVADINTKNVNPGDPGYGTPDGTVDGADLSFYVENWLAQNAGVADINTKNVNPGDPSYGTPDGVVDGADLSYFVESWLAGCG